jgi:hypothetical protein
MSSDKERQEAATGGDSDFTLSIDEAAALYERAGHPRTARSIQRYCAKGHLEYRRMETPFGEKFLINRASVERHIAYINEVRPIATSRDLPRHVATDVAGQNNEIASNDEPRQAATDNRYVAALERENEFLRGQVSVKDKLIADMQDRAHETNALINGLQRLLAPLLAAPDRQRDYNSGENP